MATDAKQVEFFPMVNQRICYSTPLVGVMYSITSAPQMERKMLADYRYSTSAITDTNTASPFAAKLKEAYEKSSEKGFIAPEIETRLIGIEALKDLYNNNIVENFVYPLADGGIAISFSKENIQYLIEIYNDNEDVFSKIEPNQPIKAWDLNHDELLDLINSEFEA